MKKRKQIKSRKRNRKSDQAENRCLNKKCGYEWKQLSGPKVQCPLCGNLWVKWIDYIEWRERHPTKH